MKIRKLGVCFLVAMLMVSFVLSSASVNAYAEETKKIGIGNLTEADLVAAWYFDEDSGDVVKDYKGNYDGTVNGTALVDTPYGKGRSFDGVDDYIQFADKVIPIGGKSIRFKIKKDNMPDHGHWEAIFSNVGSEKDSYGLHMNVSPESGKLGVFILNQNGSFSDIITPIATPYSICDGKWHDVLFTWDGKKGTENVRLFVDDMNVPVSVDNAKKLETNSPTYNLRIGVNGGIDENYFKFRGELSQIEIYSEAYNPPSAPINLIATSGNKKVNLSWDKVEDAEKYIVKRSTTKGGPYEKIGETKETSYTDSGLDNGTTYYYVLCTVKNEATSPNSNEASATPGGSSGSGDNALLKITMLNGTINEYDLSMSDIEDFIDWFEDRDDPYYIIEKDYNIGPFESRKDYIVADKILQFEVMEYND
ncbi:MAG: LamG domain-containing protein [Maledivibacter sp.]|jgi:hypothetical protein|nr:LamG domain-containing protein [Maledivibacter sp.]